MSLWVRLMVLVILLCLILPGSFGCEEDSSLDVQTPGGNGDIVGNDSEKVTITIGNLVDLTSVAANGMEPINTALKDVIEYYNENELIPGVELKTIAYDEQFDPARDKPGYEWLRQKGADLIWTPVPGAAVTLKPIADKDEYVIFSATGRLEEIMPPGYVFSLGIVAEYEAMTLMKWIAENHWDYEKNGPARIGGASWPDAYSDDFMSSAKRYAKAHPEQFEFDEYYIRDFTFNWQTEVQNLSDCDYIFLPIPGHPFAQQFADAGFSATFIGSDPNAAFLGMIDKGELWDEIDGMLYIRSSSWYNESDPMIDLTNHLLETKHPNDGEQIRRNGAGYIAVKNIMIIMDTISDTVERVGADNFDSSTLYETLRDWSYSLDGIDDYLTFNENKRYSQNYYAVYEARAEQRDIFRIHEGWLPQVMEP